MAAATSSSPAEWQWSNDDASNTTETQRPPLELQFLPPASAVAGTGTRACVSSSSWGEDPVRLQQLMMGSLAAVAAAAAASLSSPSSVMAAPVSSSAHSSSPAFTATSSPSSLSLSLTPSSSLSSAVAGTLAVSSAAAPGSRPSSPAAGDVGALFDLDTAKPLPSGYERCLDLKSGQVFIKKMDGDVCTNGTGSTSVFSKPTESKGLASKQDWSLRWLQPKNVPQNGVSAAPPASLPFVCLEKRKKQGGSLPPPMELANHELQVVKMEPREGSCLDLDLKLANQAHSSISSSFLEAPIGIKSRLDFKTMPSSPSANALRGPARSVFRTSPSLVASPSILPFVKQQQQWKWDEFMPKERFPVVDGICELARESTMATAVCSNCLMYVLLKKVSPVCPRCGTTIHFDVQKNYGHRPQQQSLPSPKRPRVGGSYGCSHSQQLL